MTEIEKMEQILTLLLNDAKPRLAGRFTLSVGYAERVFVVTPRGTGAHIRFGRQAIEHPDLFRIIKEAALAVEQHAYGLSTAAAIQLDDATRHRFECRRAWFTTWHRHATPDWTPAAITRSKWSVVTAWRRGFVANLLKGADR